MQILLDSLNNTNMQEEKKEDDLTQKSRERRQRSYFNESKNFTSNDSKKIKKQNSKQVSTWETLSPSDGPNHSPNQDHDCNWNKIRNIHI